MDDHDSRVTGLEVKVENIEKVADKLADSINALRTEFYQSIAELRKEFTHAIDRLREENNRNLRCLISVVIANMVINAGIMARLAHLI